MKLKPIEECDIDRIYELLSDKDTSYLTMNNALNFTRSGLQSYLSKTEEGTYYYPIKICLDDDSIIGAAVLNDIHPIHKYCCFSLLAVDKNFRNKGIGFKAGAKLVALAFNELNVHRVYCYAWETNDCVARRPERGGWKIDGIIRDAAYKDGKYVNKVIWNALKEDIDWALINKLVNE